MHSSIYFALVINILFFLFFNKIQKKINIFDNPNLSRKIHKISISSSGGFLFYICIAIYFVFNIFGLEENNFLIKQNSLLLIAISLFFLMGVYDDKFSLDPNTRLLWSVFFILIVILLDNNFIISELRFSFLNNKVYLKSFSILFTIICILLFINACNMFDGIDLQFGFYVLILSTVFYIKNILPYLQLIIIICCLIFLYFNFKKKIFIGNNGTITIGAIFSFLFIISYNQNKNIEFADEIFLYMAIPGFDLIRVSISRLINGKNMFAADKNHIHHLLLRKFTMMQSSIVTAFAVILPLIYASLQKNLFQSCIISFIIYISLIYFSKKK